MLFFKLKSGTNSLAMTEKHEKTERPAIMQEQGCTELEAVYAVAERIAQKRGS